ncbi:glycosyltransferase [Lacticaseibacillus paracasei]|uniref:glycosyltransferase n=1 Tax=Lacticaseibacillus paracasei TaxID=1597 RepID=UPI0025A0857D|nr:glycosyltransferase [Lacticaseibacillus paracasei]MDM7527912.1 glycosyltransferase [Lacticaseibacillus paracasei]
MIFITLGSQKFPFPRVLDYVQSLIERGVISEPVFAQTGYTKIDSYSFECKPFISRAKYLSEISICRIMITHAGTGAIISGLENHKKVIAVPREKKYSEHVDNHQFEISSAFSAAGYIEIARDEQELATAIQCVNSHQYKNYQSNTDKYIRFLESRLRGKNEK